MVAPAVRVTTPPASTTRRSSSISSSSSPPPSIARGATARSAVNPRVASTLNSPSRRGSIKSATPPPIANGETRESLATSLKREVEEKENLLVQVQNKEQTIATLTQENDNVTSALTAAETRLYELYNEQSRAEDEMAARIEVAEKLRTQVRELEKEKRDLHRRYNEQTSTFEAERQAFYDNEQHLKSRIQSLTQARRQPPVPRSPSIVIDSESEAEEEDYDQEPEQPSTPSQRKQELDAEPAEMTALRLELSTLSTSYSSLQSTLVLLQTQLVDLKRVNNQLQEENESYNILLRERTLNGQFDLFKQVGGGSDTSSEDGDEDVQTDDTGDVGSMRSGSRSQLGTVEERPEEVLDPEYDLVTDIGEDAEKNLVEGDDPDSLAASSRNSRHARHNRRHGSSASHSPGAARGESLADLPITGPGLDLAAELGRAQNKDIMEGRAIDDRDRTGTTKSGKKGKKGGDQNRKLSFSEPGMEHSASANDVDSLKTEIKSLKDANKALSLYASKIIDRIIAQEGFEHVLAIDYEPTPPTPATATATSPPTKLDAGQKPKRRNTITMFSRSASNPTPVLPQPEKLTTFDSPPLSAGLSPNPNPRPNRRSLSFDWRGFSLFNGGEKKPDPNATLRPLALKAGSSPTITGARKLETYEDEEDRRERERMHATMKLMGIEKPPAPPMQKSYSTPPPDSVAFPSSPLESAAGSASSTPPSRFSFFRRATPDSSSQKSASNMGDPANLTTEALAQAEAQNSLAALDAQERALSVELAKGGSSGFTEIVPRRKSGSKRSRTSGGGSGSTVWSAGMGHEDGEE